MDMTDREALAFYIWDYLRRHDGERPALENWLLADSILRGNRPSWLFGQDDFRPFGTTPACPPCPSCGARSRHLNPKREIVCEGCGLREDAAGGEIKGHNNGRE